MISDTDLQEALANCDRAPIQTPGTIQSFGALVALDRKFEQIEFASQTTEALLGIKAEDLLEQPISALLDLEESHRARNSLSHSSIGDQREIIGEKKFAGTVFQLSLHLKDNRSVLELLPMAESGVAGESSALEKTRALLAESVAVKDFQSTLNASVENLRASTGYDRVKAYRFLPDNTGEVVAESRASHMDSFLGLRFPASDIPPIARQLYTRTPIRVIANVNGLDSPIIGSNPDARPLDLSLAVLRGTAGVHLRYLQNMGVASTLTLPIIVGGKLWGLFAMHHMKPRVPDPTVLIGTELSGKMLGLIIEHTRQTRHQGHLNSCTAIAHEILETGESKLAEGTYWKNHGERLNAAIPSHGIAFIEGNQVGKNGSAPSVETCLAIRDSAPTASGSTTEKSAIEIVPFDDLQTRMPEHSFGNTGGALVIPLSITSDICLILFRDLALRNIKWAGDPVKELIKSDRGFELNPRNSFSSYAETVREKCDEWTNDDIEVATVLQSALTRALDIETERRDSRHRLRVMIRELNHRVRNILTLVQSLSSNSKNSATSIEGYASALEQRIVALAGAHDLLTKENMLGIQLEKIASLELRPYLDEASKTASLSGPKVLLNADVSPIIALVLHELTSNAVKYGALSQTSGTVSLSWEITDNELNIQWLEEGGPIVSEPTHEGFGRSIIEHAIPYEFGGTAQIKFKPAGVHVMFSLPADEFETVDQLVTTKNDTSETVLEQNKYSKQALKRGLIVEDNYVIAKEAKRWFEELGFEETVAVASVNGALMHLNDGKFDFCLLDVNLRGVMSEPVAKKLTDLGVPYLFASGYGSEGSELCNQFDAPFLTKPINIDSLRNVLKELGVGEW